MARTCIAAPGSRSVIGLACTEWKRIAMHGVAGQHLLSHALPQPVIEGRLCLLLLFVQDWGPAFVPVGLTGRVELVGFDRATLIGALVSQQFNSSSNTFDLTVTAQFVVPAGGDNGTLSLTLAALELQTRREVRGVLGEGFACAVLPVGLRRLIVDCRALGPAALPDLAAQHASALHAAALHVGPSRLAELLLLLMLMLALLPLLHPLLLSCGH